MPIESHDYDKKICPLLSNSNDGFQYCLKDECGLWSHGTKRCAFIALLRKE